MATVMRHFPSVSEANRHSGERAALVAILAGGEGRRIGGCKPSMLLAAAPLLSYPLRAARAAGLEVAVVAKLGSQLPALDCPVLHERAHPQHPLCGIVAALRDRRAAVLAVGCDMPFLTGPLLAWMAGLAGSAVAEAGGDRQPLLARYVPADVPLLEAAAQEGRSAREAVAMLDARVVREGELARFGDPNRLLFNVNARDELEQAERWLAA